MLERKKLVKCGMLFLAFAAFSQGSAFMSDPLYSNYDVESLTLKEDSLLAKKGKATSKTDTTKTNDIAVNNGVIITSSGANSFENLENDEVFTHETHIKREIVLEEEFKLWRIYVQKGRKNTEYRKVEVPFGTYFKKNQIDITEEAYIQETKDLPEGEVKRYQRDEYEAKDRERIMQEINARFEIKTIPMDSTNVDSTNTDIQQPEE